jgi:hypothetical protein
MTGDGGKPLSQGPEVRQILETAIYVQDVARVAQFYDRVVAYDAGSATVLLLFKRSATLLDLVLPGGTIPYQDVTGRAIFASPSPRKHYWTGKTIWSRRAS